MEKQKEAIETDVGAMIGKLVKNAEAALAQYMELNQQQVDEIVHAMTLAGLDNHLALAKLAFEETGRGVVEDKVIKNMFATEYIYHSIKDEKTVGVIAENELEGYVEVAEPVGVIAGVTPGDQPPPPPPCSNALSPQKPVTPSFLRSIPTRRSLPAPPRRSCGMLP